MPAFTTTIIGFFMGFGFGVGCALAVFYSLYMHGYRAALKDLELSEPPERLIKERERLAREKPAKDPLRSSTD